MDPSLLISALESLQFRRNNEISINNFDKAGQIKRAGAVAFFINAHKFQPSCFLVNISQGEVCFYYVSLLLSCDKVKL